MIKYDLATLSNIIGGELNEKLGVGRKTVSGVSIDSRTIKEGELFIPVRGETFDGHDYIDDAIANGAIAYITEKDPSVDHKAIPYIKVEDSLKALGELAHHHRKNMPAKIIGLTGSLGKTTSKAMLASILREQFKVLAPAASMNNAIGVPLTLLKLTKEHDYAVIEMGTNHFGEIEYVTSIAEPDVAICLNIAPAHLEFLKNLDGVFKEKSAIFSKFRGNNIAILNADDAYYQRFLNLNTVQHSLSYGISNGADVMAKNIKINESGCAEFECVIDSKSFPISLTTLGRHNVYNALAAICAAKAVGIDDEACINGLQKMQAVSKRLVKKTGMQGVTIIDDSYSAIPNAVFAAIDILARVNNKKIFVFGGMAELEPKTAEEMHKQVGLLAKKLGVDYLFTLTDRTKATVSAFGHNGFYFENKTQLLKALKAKLGADVTVLIKGSRGVKMEEIVQAIQA